jgi:hypothetical protein
MISPYETKDGISIQMVGLEDRKPSEAGKLLAKLDESSGKGGLVQFRADSNFLMHLGSVATRLQLPVGVLARLWVAERLAKELAFDNASIEKWLDERHQEILGRVAEFDLGPVQMIHMVPQNRELKIDPEKMRKIHNDLPPVERITEFNGRINRLGYKTEKSFRNSDKMSGVVQVFRTGQLESVRILHVDEMSEALYGDQLDDDLIRAIWSYGGALSSLGIALPLKVFLRFSGLKGLTLRSRYYRETTTVFDDDSFSIPPVEITDWSMLKRIESTAAELRSTLDVLWNAAGFRGSPNYSSDGTWRGPLDDRADSELERRTKPVVPSKADLRIDVTDPTGQALQHAHVVLIAENKTIVSGKTNATGQVTLSPPKKGLATVFCAHAHALPHIETNFDKERKLVVQLELCSNGGSIVCENGTGHIPGLQGHLNPIKDTANRLYLYADNIAIEGGVQQPCSFKLGQELRLEDAQGVVMKIRIHDIIGRTSLIEYHFD